MSDGTSLRDIRILIAEDEALIAEELRVRLSRLGAQIVGVQNTAAAAADRALETRPDVMLMDIRLQGQDDGIDAVRRVRRQIDVAVVYLTAHSDRGTLTRAKDAGPCAYVTKPFEERQLAVAIEMALHARGVDAVQLRETRVRYESLTERERTVFKQVAMGLRNRSIADNLGITERTVKAHRAAVMTKMREKTIAGLIKHAVLLRLAPMP